MKTTKRILSVMLATLLLATMTILPASAAGGHTIRIANEVAGHTYEAYQLFSGVLNEKGIMTEIQWGASIPLEKQAGLGSAETKAGTLKTVADAEAFGYEIDEHLGDPVATTNSWGTMSNGQAGYEITGLDTGYYLIMDKSGSVEDLEGNPIYDAYTQYIIQVVDNVDVSPKSAVPTLLKRVSLQADRNYAKAVSSVISGTVYYQLIASMHSHISTYPEYYMQLVDTLPAGLKDAALVSVGVANGENYTDQETVPAQHYTFDAAGDTVTVTLKDAKAAIKAATGEDALIDDKIVITYQATLDSDAVVGQTPTDGNVNAAVLFYSNDPNEDYDPATDAKPTHIGKTSPSEATVYTYQIRMKKIDASDETKMLAGAQFIAYRYTSTNVKAYYQVDTATGKVTGLVADESQATKLTTDADGMLSIIGLPSGTHHFKEVVAPNGYNLLTTEISVIITAAADAATGKLSSFKGEATGTARPVIVDMAKGDLLVTVENRIGSTLPETGGIGTTIFYVAGIALMLGAVVVVMAKKRSTESK